MKNSTFHNGYAWGMIAGASLLSIVLAWPQAIAKETLAAKNVQFVVTADGYLQPVLPVAFKSKTNAPRGTITCNVWKSNAGDINNIILKCADGNTYTLKGICFTEGN